MLHGLILIVIITLFSWVLCSCCLGCHSSLHLESVRPNLDFLYFTMSPVSPFLLQCQQWLLETDLIILYINVCLILFLSCWCRCSRTWPEAPSLKSPTSSTYSCDQNPAGNSIAAAFLESSIYICGIFLSSAYSQMNADITSHSEFHSHACFMTCSAGLLLLA